MKLPAKHNNYVSDHTLFIACLLYTSDAADE